MIATAVALPVTIILASALSPDRRAAGPAPAPADPPVTAQGAQACRVLMRRLPAELDGTARTPTAGRAPFVAAWGRSPIVLQCGVARPRELAAYSTAQLIGSGQDLSVNWLPVTRGTTTVWTVIDRSVYIRLTVPNTYATPPIDELSTIVARVLPAVCTVSMTAGRSQSQSGVLCTHRR